MVTIPMNRTGIKFLIADFEMMFGRSSGKAVQALCISKNWPLVWARTDLPDRWSLAKLLPRLLECARRLSGTAVGQ